MSDDSCDYNSENKVIRGHTIRLLGEGIKKVKTKDKPPTDLKMKISFNSHLLKKSIGPLRIQIGWRIILTLDVG